MQGQNGYSTCVLTGQPCTKQRKDLLQSMDNDVEQLTLPPLAIICCGPRDGCRVSMTCRRPLIQLRPRFHPSCQHCPVDEQVKCRFSCCSHCSRKFVKPLGHDSIPCSMCLKQLRGVKQRHDVLHKNFSILDMSSCRNQSRTQGTVYPRERWCQRVLMVVPKLLPIYSVRQQEPVPNSCSQTQHGNLHFLDYRKTQVVQPAGFLLRGRGGWNLPQPWPWEYLFKRVLAG